jgi:flagellar biosynthetic protein FlhB
VAESNHDRTEQPTPRRRQRAREHGQVVHSRELHAAIVLLAAVMALKLGGSRVLGEVLVRWQESLQGLGRRPVVAADMPGLGLDWWWWGVRLLLPFFAVVATAAIAAGVAIQGGFSFSMQGAIPNPSRLDPIAGARRMFSARTGFAFGRDLLKLVLVGWVCTSGMRDAIALWSREPDLDLPAQMVRLGTVGAALALRTGIVLVGVGLLDYVYQRRQFTQEIKMSKQEIREEHKETEGDPLVRSRIRSRQRDLSRRRMMEAVPTADVVLTNPTTLAIALKYDAVSMQAPRVVAKGQRLIAERIKEIARQAGVPVIEDKPLARALFRLAPVGAEIPTELYRAVAEVLGYVYRIEGKGAGKNPRPPRGGER